MTRLLYLAIALVSFSFLSGCGSGSGAGSATLGAPGNGGGNNGGNMNAYIVRLFAGTTLSTIHYSSIFDLGLASQTTLSVTPTIAAGQMKEYDISATSMSSIDVDFTAGGCGNADCHAEIYKNGVLMGSQTPSGNGTWHPAAM